MTTILSTPAYSCRLQGGFPAPRHFSADTTLPSPERRRTAAMGRDRTANLSKLRVFSPKPHGAKILTSAPLETPGLRSFERPESGMSFERRYLGVRQRCVRRAAPLREAFPERLLGADCGPSLAALVGPVSARSRHRSRCRQNIAKGGLGSFEADTRGDRTGANSGQSPTAWRTDQIDPKRTVTRGRRAEDFLGLSWGSQNGKP